MFHERIQHCQGILKARGIDCFVVPTSDFHDSEYVGGYFKGRKHLSGFTGSAGTLVITQNRAALWTDGRYFIQAEKELEGSSIVLMRMDEPGVPKIEEYLWENMSENGVLAFDGRVVNYKLGEAWLKKLHGKNATVKIDYDLVDEVWTDRPDISKEKIYLLDEKYCGKTYESKKRELLDIMDKEGASVLIDASLDNIMWFLNIRGNDVAYNPVVLSYLVLAGENATIYVDQDKIDETAGAYFKKNNILVKDYFAIYEDVPKLKNEHVWVDSAKVNYALYSAIHSTNVIVNRRSPITKAKAMKNEVEIQNLRNCHLKDGVAVTKFMYWLKNNVGKQDISEVSAQEYLQTLREQQNLFIEPSFETISGYKEHGAMMHYSATLKSDVKLLAEGFLLVDSGGQYMDGTTDITRTFVLGPITKEEKVGYTLVLKGMLSLSRQKFMYGCGGMNLDILARSALWNSGIDYQCGTGHGVGFLLNVHEGPQNCKWKKTEGGGELETFEEGMIITNEPGVYEEGRYGVRIENELVVRKDVKNAYGQFMSFETITYAPIDLDGVEVGLLSTEEKTFLNEYHRMVYNKIAPFLTAEEALWLEKSTKSI